MLTPRPRAHQPFAESIAVKLKPGLKSRLSTPTPPDLVTSTIRELEPLIGETNRAVDVIADIVDQPGWQSGASVNGIVILSERSAVVVPEQSVVLRPAGEVVYVIKDGVAHQRIVKTDRKSVVSGKSVSVRVDLGGRRTIKKKQKI